ncbi:hypothetical protein ABZY16_16140 [Streptomyces sp. NPDC006553]|uniref:hypothetical protein n=1 Tax=unclassified Streptomyces TaxID=2593676 RepID=UPI00224E644C|nr:hypothetical protein [Streptomyces sp. NBC_00233]MCX5231310.1 hypothetical protein [Streptomyces sp. NBC_00233]
MSVGFEDALKLGKPGFERVKAMGRIGPAAALLDEGEAERGAAAALQALDGVARVDSMLVGSRLNTLFDAPARTGPPRSTRSGTGRGSLPALARPPSRPESIERMGKQRRHGPRTSRPVPSCT